MSQIIADITITADGYAAGLNQSEQRPFGDDGGDGSGARLHAWMFDTPEENRAESPIGARRRRQRMRTLTVRVVLTLPAWSSTR